MKKEEIKDKPLNQREETSSVKKETPEELAKEGKEKMIEDESKKEKRKVEDALNQNDNEKKEVSKEETLAQELASFKDKYLRLYSDFDNFRKRTSKEKVDLIKTASEEIIVSLLDVLDDFERANKSFLESKEKDSKLESPLKEGFDLIHQKIIKTFEQKGLTSMHSLGKDFDTELHEAITQISASEENMKGKVMDVVEKGYFLNEKVIRFAKVVIGA